MTNIETTFYLWVYTGKIIWVLEGNKTYLANKYVLLRDELEDLEI